VDEELSAQAQEHEEIRMTEPTDTETTVRSLLNAAGMTTLTDEQVQIFVRAYPTLRAAADRLYTLPEVRYEQPAVIYSAR
jgi:hypothetical protein